MAAEQPPVRFGILGCANIARKVSRAMILSPNSTIVAIGSRSLEKAANFAKNNGFPVSAKAYGSYDAVLDDPNVDAVYIPLPTSLHLKWAVAAAKKKKHILLDKPVALNVKELDLILEACESNGLQFMDATMWMHHPRTSKMKEFLIDSHSFGQLKTIHSIFSYNSGDDFLKNDIRVKPDLDALGALGDTGWYSIRAILWATDYELPKTVTALPDAEFNEDGVILSCAASLRWEDGKRATFYCSFLTNLTMDISVLGANGYLRVHDFVIPFQENVGPFYVTANTKFAELSIGIEPAPTEHKINTDLPQEALMVKEFSGLVSGIKEHGSGTEKKWPTISRKTQILVDAVKASIDKGFEPIEINKSDYKLFKMEGCKYYHTLGEIFSGTSAIGGLGNASTQLPNTSEEERQLEDDFLNKGVHVRVENDDEVDEVSNNCRREEVGTSGERRRKEPKIGKSNKLESYMAQWSSTVSTRNKETELRIFYLKEKLAKIQGKSCNQSDSEVSSRDPYSIVICMDILNNMERVSNEVYMKAIQAFKDSTFRVSFVKMLEARRGPILELL